MLIGVPTEIKNSEYRVGLTPDSVHELVSHGHTVYIQHNAGARIGFYDTDYQAVGAEILPDAQAIFDQSEMIVKVKEPQPDECRMLKANQLLFTYLHLAPDPQQTQLLMDSGCSAIAYETVTDQHGHLPLLTPMSEVAGRLSVQAGAACLECHAGGSGILLGGVPGTKPANVVVIGGGVVGLNAIKIALGMQANVTVLDNSLPRLRELNDLFGAELRTLYSNKANLQSAVSNADLVIGAVLIPGAAAPKLITHEHLQSMRAGSVLVDVAIDQGGCFETSHATTHQQPTYEIDGVIHYCVANMPGAVSKTATKALNNATLPFVVKLANQGRQALINDPHLRNGLNVHQGQITCQAVSNALNLSYVDPLEALE